MTDEAMHDLAFIEKPGEPGSVGEAAVQIGPRQQVPARVERRVEVAAALEQDLLDPRERIQEPA